jgi:hypothetical protein
MPDLVRALTASGTERFQLWLKAARLGSTEAPPLACLVEEGLSEARHPGQAIERQPGSRSFESRYTFGLYLCDRLHPFAKTAISRDTGLWNWLSLYFIDQLAPPLADQRRRILDTEVYVLAPVFKYDSYYRHAIRSCWLAALEHGDASRVLLVPAGKARPGTGTLAHRGELIEQLASRQQVMGSRTIIAGAAELYLDSNTGRPKSGAAGRNGGSPRRLAAVIQQLDRTYDLNALTVEQFLDLLPGEFDRWKPARRQGVFARIFRRRKKSEGLSVHGP